MKQMFNRKFTIEEGNHYSEPIYIRLHLNKKEMVWAVMFPDEVLGVTKDRNILEWNKLFGFSRGFHHDNSFRFSWRENGEKIELSAYTYLDGIRYLTHDSEKTIEIEPNRIYLYKIRLNNKKVMYDIFDDKENNVYSHSQVIRKMLPVWGYNLKPYFGGNSTPIKDVNILVNSKI